MTDDCLNRSGRKYFCTWQYIDWKHKCTSTHIEAYIHLHACADANVQTKWFKETNITCMSSSVFKRLLASCSLLASPRWLIIASISSRNIVDGAWCLASSNKTFINFSESPAACTNFESDSLSVPWQGMVLQNRGKGLYFILKKNSIPFFPSNICWLMTRRTMVQEQNNGGSWPHFNMM